MPKKTPRCLFGIETELGVYAETSPGHIRPAPAELAAALVEDVAAKYRHLPSPCENPARRIFLANGACAYVDIGGHPEIATGECSDPMVLAAHNLALRKIMAQAAESVSRVYGMPIKLVANNVDYSLGQSSTYGHHLNILIRGISFKQAVRRLTPLLAAMPILAGAGKISFASQARGFELLQRSSYMFRVVSTRTTDSRGMITSKDEPLSDKGFRLHIVSLDTNISPCQLVLVPAIIALGAKAVESSGAIGDRLELADPVGSLQIVSGDPSLRAQLPLASGRTASGLDILEAYRALVEESANRGGMPQWTDTILTIWKDVLTNLRTDPFLEYGRLDWINKLVLFTRMLENNALDWREFSRWGYTLASVRRLKSTWPELSPEELTSSASRRMSIRRSALGVLESHFAKHKLSWKDFPHIWHTSNRLSNACVQYHVLNRPESPGERACRLVTQEAVELAKTTPPKGTRAEVRARAIESAPPGSEAWWTFVRSAGRRLVMDDPFGERAVWIKENKNTREQK
jgi:hypothetical protein